MTELPSLNEAEAPPKFARKERVIFFSTGQRGYVYTCEQSLCDGSYSYGIILHVPRSDGETYQIGFESTLKKEAEG